MTPEILDEAEQWLAFLFLAGIIGLMVTLFIVAFGVIVWACVKAIQEERRAKS